jgi:hypothetical protein
MVHLTVPTLAFLEVPLKPLMRILVFWGGLGGSRGSIVTMRLGTSNPHGDCRVGHQYVSVAAWSGFGPATWSGFGPATWSGFF